MASVGMTRQEYWEDMYNRALDMLRVKHTDPRKRHAVAEKYADKKTAELFDDRKF